MLSLSLRSATDILPLDGLLKGEAGVQATSGAMGFGLPPLAHQWVEGAGHGATHRGYRALSRTIDLPLTLEAPTRPELKALLRRLSLILAAPATLRAHDSDGSAWDLEVVRSGGGDYTYGTDTTGDTSLDLVVTLTAGDPFWTRVDQSSFLVEAPPPGAGLLPALTGLAVAGSQALGDRVVENPGDVEAYPVWRVDGPGRNFEAKSATGETIRWLGSLAANEVLHIDSGKGTVVDGKGVNRYAELAAAPKFWPIKPGVSEVSVRIDGASVGTPVAVRDTRTNLTPNPLPSGATGSSPTNWRSAAVDNALAVITDEGQPAIAVTKGASVSYYIDPVGPATNARWPLKLGDAWRMVTDVKVLKPQRVRLVGATYGSSGVGGVRIFDQSVDMTPEDGWRTLEASGYVTDEAAVDGRFLVWPAYLGPRNLNPQGDLNATAALALTGDDALLLTMTEVDRKAAGVYWRRNSLLTTSVTINNLPSADAATGGKFIAVGIDVRAKGHSDTSVAVKYSTKNAAGATNTASAYLDRIESGGSWTRQVVLLEVPDDTVATGSLALEFQAGFADPNGIPGGAFYYIDNWSVHQATTAAAAMAAAQTYISPQEGVSYLVRRTMIQNGPVLEDLTGDFFHGGSPATPTQVYRTVPNSNGSLPTSVESEAEMRGVTRISCAWRPRSWAVI